jgi:hypothetical protein
VLGVDDGFTLLELHATTEGVESTGGPMRGRPEQTTVSQGRATRPPFLIVTVGTIVTPREIGEVAVAMTGSDPTDGDRLRPQ